MKRRGLHGGRVSSSPTEGGGDVATRTEECSVVIAGLRWSHLVGALVVFRTVNALLCYSAFVPDEYWQALEVAHNMVFGYPNPYSLCRYCSTGK